MRADHDVARHQQAKLGEIACRSTSLFFILHLIQEIAAVREAGRDGRGQLCQLVFVVLHDVSVVFFSPQSLSRNWNPRDNIKHTNFPRARRREVYRRYNPNANSPD
jgi:hypothetical protein